MKLVRRLVGVSSAVVLTAGFLLSSASAWAEDTSIDEVTITVPSSCTMTGTLNTAHTTSLLSGETANNIGTTTLKVICNDSAGYAIYAIGYTDDVYGKTVLTSSALGSSYDIATATTVTTGTSSWAMKLATSGSSYMPVIVGSTGDLEKESSTPDFSNYVAVPTEYTRVAYRNSATDVGTGALGSSLTTTYRVYVSPVQPAGTYIGQVKYTMVHPSTEAAPMAPLKDSDCPAGNVCYAPNTNDIEGSMATLGAISSSDKAGKKSYGTSATTANLIAPNYKRSGYGFAGWSTSFDATTATNPVIYGPNETITVNLSASGLILYPVWVENAGNLQGWNGCNSLTTAPTNTRATLSSVTALTDTRDGNVYTVARLADGKCWMVENLRLNAEDSRGDANKAKAQGYGDATANDQGKFIGLADSEDANFTGSPSSATDPTTANSIYYAGTQSGTATIDIFQTNYAGFRMPRYNNNNTNRNLTPSYNGTGSTTYYQWFGYGNYYSWPAAISDTSHRNQNNTSATTTSICPTGWRLPIGGQTTVNTTGDFYVLTKTLMGGTEPNASNTNGSGYYQGTVDNVDLGAKASKSLRAFPNNLVYSGYFNGSSSYYRNGEGAYWSSSTSSNHYSYRLDLGGSFVRPGTSIEYKGLGQSVRCIAQ